MHLIGLCGRDLAAQNVSAVFLREHYAFEWALFHATGSHASDLIARSVAQYRQTRIPGVVIGAVASEALAAAIRAEGGQIWHVWTPPSRMASGFAGYTVDTGIVPRGEDRGILNDGTEADLARRVDQLLHEREAKAAA